MLGDEEVYGELVKDWCLVRLIRPKASLHLKEGIQDNKYLDNHLQMSWGDWGLTYSNDPDFIFCNDPLPKYSKAKNYSAVCRIYNHQLTGPVELSYKLVESCIEAGFNLKKDKLSQWLMDKMYIHLKECNWIPKDVYPCISSSNNVETMEILS